MNSMSFEALKEVARWITLAVIAWFVAETLKQAELIPQVFALKLWVFEYLIPVRELFVLVMTVVSRIIDRLVHDSPDIEANGILPF